jgi:hypothetical protein
MYFGTFFQIFLSSYAVSPLCLALERVLYSHARPITAEPASFYLLFSLPVVPVHKVPGGNSGPKSEPAERAHNKFYKSRVPSQYFTLDIFILSATLPPRSPGPSGSPSPTRSGPEPLWIHPRPTRPRGTSQPPVHATGAGKPRPTVICCEVADKNQYNKLLGVVRITVQESGSDWFTTVNYLAF